MTPLEKNIIKNYDMAFVNYNGYHPFLDIVEDDGVVVGIMLKDEGGSWDTKSWSYHRIDRLPVLTNNLGESYREMMKQRTRIQLHGLLFKLASVDVSTIIQKPDEEH